MEIFGLDLFNSEFKKHAENDLKKIVEEYKKSISDLKKSAHVFQRSRDNLSNEIHLSGILINKWTNTPKEFNEKYRRIIIEVQNYNNLLDVTKQENEKVVKSVKSGTAGTLVGGTIATLGGPALTTIAMSIGTASTGTAISGLTGAAATNATLAWLGGGTLAAGGGGVVGGEALLSILGPIGWAIGGASLLATGFSVNKKNKKAVDKIDKTILTLKKLVNDNKSKIFYLNKLNGLTVKSFSDLRLRRIYAIQIKSIDFSNFNEKEKYFAGTLVNNTLSASEVLNKKLGDE